MPGDLGDERVRAVRSGRHPFSPGEGEQGVPDQSGRGVVGLGQEADGVGQQRGGPGPGVAAGGGHQGGEETSLLLLQGGAEEVLEPGGRGGRGGLLRRRRGGRDALDEVADEAGGLGAPPLVEAAQGRDRAGRHGEHQVLEQGRVEALGQACPGVPGGGPCGGLRVRLAECLGHHLLEVVLETAVGHPHQVAEDLAGRGAANAGRYRLLGRTYPQLPGLQHRTHGGGVVRHPRADSLVVRQRAFGHQGGVVGVGVGHPDGFDGGGHRGSPRSAARWRSDTARSAVRRGGRYGAGGGRIGLGPPGRSRSSDRCRVGLGCRQGVRSAAARSARRVSSAPAMESRSTSEVPS